MTSRGWGELPCTALAALASAALGVAQGVSNATRAIDAVDAVGVAFDRYFAAAATARADICFEPADEAALRTVAGDARLRELAFAAFRRAPHPDLRADHAQRRVGTAERQSRYTVEAVGARPPNGWALVVAMHGGGGVATEVNDQQWEHMQGYYRSHPESGGYLYVALRAPNDTWNGFYDDAFVSLFERLVRQFVVCAEVDPDRVFAIGYSHGGYGAFALAPKLPHRFAAVHASAAAPTDGECAAINLHTLPFSFMVGGRDLAHDRRSRCEAFASELLRRRAEHRDHYATAFTLVADQPHTGLPDRELLPSLLLHRRVTSPRQLWWQPTDTVVRDHYWLRVEAPQDGMEFTAALQDNVLHFTRRRAAAAEVWLDARLCDLRQDLVVETDGGEPVRLPPAPSLQTLCATLAERGDPGLAASWIVRLP